MGLLDRSERREGASPAFDRIARRIGVQLRDVYREPEAEALPIEHVNLLLRLRQKERDRARIATADL